MPTSSSLKSVNSPKLPVPLHAVVVDLGGDSTSEAGEPLEGDEKLAMLSLMGSDGDFGSVTRETQETMVIPPLYDLEEVSWTYSSFAAGFRTHLQVGLEDILSRPFLQNFANDWPPEELDAQPHAICQRCNRDKYCGEKSFLTQTSGATASFARAS